MPCQSPTGSEQASSLNRAARLQKCLDGDPRVLIIIQANDKAHQRNWIKPVRIVCCECNLRKTCNYKNRNLNLNCVRGHWPQIGSEFLPVSKPSLQVFMSSMYVLIYVCCLVTDHIGRVHFYSCSIWWRGRLEPWDYVCWIRNLMGRINGIIIIWFFKELSVWNFTTNTSSMNNTSPNLSPDFRSS